MNNHQIKLFRAIINQALHDAMYDIEQNYEVFKKMIWEVDV